MKSELGANHSDRGICTRIRKRLDEKFQMSLLEGKSIVETVRTGGRKWRRRITWLRVAVVLIRVCLGIFLAVSGVLVLLLAVPFLLEKFFRLLRRCMHISASSAA